MHEYPPPAVKKVPAHGPPALFSAISRFCEARATNRRRVVALATILCALSFPLRAETPWRDLSKPVFQSLGAEAGLPNPVALAIAEDPSGFLWIGTASGLARWDGYRFRVFGTDARAPDLADAFVQALHVDAGGTLWVGTGAGGVARYDPDDDSFVTLPLAGVANGHVEVRAFADDGAHGLWIATDHGVFHLGKGDSAARLVPETLAWGHALALLRDRSGVLWIGTAHGLFRAPAASVFEPVPLPSDAAAAGPVMSLAQDSAGNILVGTFKAGAFIIDAASRAARHITGDDPDPHPVDEIGQLDVEGIIEGQPGEIWLATPGRGIVAVTEATGHSRRIRHDAAQPASLSGDIVSDFYRDRAGTLWIATDHGLSFAAAGSNAFSTLLPMPGDANSIADPNVTSVLAVGDRIWLGLQHSGIDLIEPAAHSIARLPGHAALPGTILAHLAASPGNGVFIATWAGLFHADPLGGTVTPVFPAEGHGTGAILTVAAAAGAMWFPEHGEVFRFRPGSDPSPRPMLSVARLTDRRVRTILDDGENRLWLGTWDGLNLFDATSGQIDQVRPDNAVSDGLSAGLITCLIKDRRGRLWVGTNRGGIDILVGRSPAGRMMFRHLGVEDGLPNPNVDTLLMAPDGHLWASTDDGLADIDPDTLHVRAFRLADGVAISAYWTDSGAVTRDGDLLFGGAGGLTVVHPGSLRPPSPHPRLVVTELRVGGRKRSSARLNSSGTVAPLKIEPENNRFAVEFSALDYAAPAQDTYAYMLEGMDRSWIVSDPSQRLAAYTNLPPGPYTLRLRATIAGAGGAPAAWSVPIVVLPAWYQTIPAKLALMVLCVVAVGGMIHGSTLLLRRRQRELEQIVVRRTSELLGSNAALSDAVQTLGDLSALCREITASLDTDVVLTSLHRGVVSLTDTSGFCVYLIGAEEGRPVWRFEIQDDQRLAAEPARTYQTSIVARAIREQSEIVMANRGLVCVPLMVLERVIGAILMSSRHGDIFGDRERVVLRTLCSYGAIALGNAETMVRLADMHARLEQIAYSDSLTALPNRRAFNEHVNLYITRAMRRSGKFALLLIDLDDFKNVNDSYGHDIGDALLVRTAECLRSIVRGGDQVLRLGGDEFAVLIDSVHDQRVLRDLCGRIAELFSAGTQIGDRPITSHASIGVAIFPDDAAVQEQLYKAADVALYAAKRAGGGRAVFFEPALDAADRSDRQTKHDLAHALHADELVVFYQPVFSVGDRTLRGLEALLRWKHPGRGLLGPADFIAIAEKTGLISAIGDFVLYHAVAMARRLMLAGNALSLSVNLSVRHLAEGYVAEKLGRMLDMAELDPVLMCIEVTESSLINEAAVAELHRLKALGVRIAIDDFGTGYSSLAYLPSLPINILKIDQRFVAAMQIDGKAVAFFAAIVDLARTLGLHTVAEGCETEAQYDFIRDAGCDDVQGWLFGRAMDSEALAAFLSASQEQYAYQMASG